MKRIGELDDVDEIGTLRKPLRTLHEVLVRARRIASCKRIDVTFQARKPGLCVIDTALDEDDATDALGEKVRGRDHAMNIAHPGGNGEFFKVCINACDFWTGSGSFTGDRVAYGEAFRLLSDLAKRYNTVGKMKAAYKRTTPDKGDTYDMIMETLKMFKNNTPSREILKAIQAQRDNDLVMAASLSASLAR